MALEMARRSCVPAGHPNACAHYHGFWQFLRLLGMGKTMSGFTPEFVAAVRTEALARPDRPIRVLISGCADYSAFAHVWQAGLGLPHTPATTALDLCETPLELTRWYARHQGGQVETVRQNVLEYQVGPCFDLILTSSFFGYFNPDQRRQLFRAYAGLLTPGGALVFTTRLVNQPEDVRVGFAPRQARDLVDQVLQALTQLPTEASLSPAEAEELARAYAGRRGSYPVNSLRTIELLAEQAGLRVDDSIQRRSEAKSSSVSGPTVGTANYLFVTLRKPA